ncbi:hypothetical protein ACMGDH_09710 [Sphingomonas sp. DT-207]|uniref:hypothetical protein n=1 Tax=Sphingomonas sp. DT-207 TaxID=3396167 RepID=UPI003F1E3DBB
MKLKIKRGPIVRAKTPNLIRKSHQSSPVAALAAIAPGSVTLSQHVRSGNGVVWIQIGILINSREIGRGSAAPV